MDKVLLINDSINPKLRMQLYKSSNCNFKSSRRQSIRKSIRETASDRVRVVDDRGLVPGPTDKIPPYQLVTNWKDKGFDRLR